jgi:propionyl-CoA carboxylase beta chain
MGGMGLGGAVEILHRRRIAEADNPDELRARLLEELRNKMRAFPTGRNYGLDDVIDPRDTRATLIRALGLLSCKDPHLPPKKHGINPM